MPPHEDAPGPAPARLRSTGGGSDGGAANDPTGLIGLEQFQFLAEASRRLASSLELTQILERLASAAVPFLADWCVVDMLERDGSARRMLVHHRDRAKAGVCDALKRYGPRRDRRIPITQVLESGRPVLLEEISEEVLEGVAQSGEHRALIEDLGMDSAIIVPLEARGRCLGTLMLVSSSSDRRFGPSDLLVSQDLAQRAGLALDNSRLFQEYRALARKLQESLLPPSMPDIPGVEVGARYAAAGEGVDVGGDFYDFFRIGRRNWGIVIGDVSGKGPEAAGITALARYTTRAAAMQARSPRRILNVLNQALLAETSDERFATMVFARIEAGEMSGPRKMVLACCGHPHPLILRARDGSIEEVGEAGSLLGMLEKIAVRDDSAQLFPGDMVFFYTDGVTEARRSDGRLLGGAGLRRLVHRCAGADARAAAHYLEREVLSYQDDEPRDDLAVVVVRVLPAPSEA